MMSVWLTYLAGILILLSTFQVEDKVDIYLIGDSTVSTYPEDYYPRMGWGQTFGSYFQEDKVEVHNKAVSGRSTKSFIDEGLWQNVLNELDEGDYLLIQFGHNDMKTEREELYAAPFDEYTENLMTFIEKARAKKAIPILITPVYRRRFKDGMLQNSLGEYPLAMRKLADKKDVPLIDLHKKSYELFSALGEEKTKDIFLWLKAGEYKNYPDGNEDNSHFSEEGAMAVSQLVIDEMKRLGLAVTTYLK